MENWNRACLNVIQAGAKFNWGPGVFRRAGYARQTGPSATAFCFCGRSVRRSARTETAARPTGAGAGARPDVPPAAKGLRFRPAAPAADILFDSRLVSTAPTATPRRRLPTHGGSAGSKTGLCSFAFSDKSDGRDRLIISPVLCPLPKGRRHPAPRAERAPLPARRRWRGRTPDTCENPALATSAAPLGTDW